MDLFDDINEKFQELEDGKYIVRIESFRREKTGHNMKPIRWELKLMNESPLILPSKFSHIETDGGFQILMRELKNLGYSKPCSAREFEEILTSLKGSIVEVSVTTTNKDEGYREVRFLRKLY
ncbi:hypothetical protein ELQ35_07925 [Peribacillus cavernae]|uniref:DUF669 domain-containing protein n=1 Tax=Peribacillus cavernae TaxID=1674310 RepID=A0A433HPL4_9BACI|nr:hypothetical protein [Peribacillus cavernae]MDQ0217276.1 putative transcriptional regulator [Peribacillus cavernae]RUQ30257.1 hypothetical protein ELQ35_07925 [Peribacillus cavernae]